MKILLALIVIFFLSCSGSQKSHQASSFGANDSIKISNPTFQSLIDSSSVIGSILVYSIQKDTYYSNDFKWANRGQLPASTFKIANTIIGLETGVIKSDTMMFEWDGQDRLSSSWEKDLVLRDAFHLSCVPCYQEVAREVDVERMEDYAQRLDYGNIAVDSSTIHNFWLVGTSRISQMEQVSFLESLYHSELPISKRTEKIIKDLMVMERNGQYVLSGKTGLSNEDDHYNGWFVGMLEAEGQTLLFATNIEPKDQQNRIGFTGKRKEITMSALNELLPIYIKK